MMPDWQVLTVALVAISLQIMASINLMFGRSAVKKCNISRAGPFAPVEVFGRSTLLVTLQLGVAKNVDSQKVASYTAKGRTVLKTSTRLTPQTAIDRVPARSWCARWRRAARAASFLVVAFSRLSPCALANDNSEPTGRYPRSDKTMANDKRLATDVGLHFNERLRHLQGARTLYRATKPQSVPHPVRGNKERKK